ncbi:MAG: 5'/3'-nucleotidase SurE [Planctomycetota bacterium]|nr:MAG: 5'/3'-nucleotidase SurE [Planctomycetota bacterium]
MGFPRLLISSALLLPACGAAPTNPDPIERLHILVVNDDGIHSPGIVELVKAMSAIGEVVVCAPDSNRSGASHSSVAFSQTMEVTEIEMEGASYACSISGTPSDATLFGIIQLGADHPFDLIVSGINRGANVGNIAHYSGTIGAAMEANYHGIPAVAASQDSQVRDFAPAAAWTAKFAEQMLNTGAQGDICWSLNFPEQSDGRWPGAIVAPMDGAYIHITGFSSRDGGYRANFSFNGEYPEGSDTAAFMDGWISVTPLRFDWTDFKLVESAAEWLPPVD